MVFRNLAEFNESFATLLSLITHNWGMTTNSWGKQNYFQVMAAHSPKKRGSSQSFQGQKTGGHFSLICYPFFPLLKKSATVRGAVFFWFLKSMSTKIQRARWMKLGEWKAGFKEI